MNDVQVIQVIKTRLFHKGSGRDGEVMRIIEQYWAMDGSLLWQFDTYTGDMYSPMAQSVGRSFADHALQQT